MPRAAAVDLAGLGQGAVGVDAQKGADRAVVALDLVKIRLGRFDGRGAAASISASNCLAESSTSDMVQNVRRIG